jgi:hypothetical protein
MEASRVIFLDHNKYCDNVNWTYMTGPEKILKLTREWKNDPDEDILEDFKLVLSMKPPWWIRKDFTMFETVLTWCNLNMDENELNEVVENLFFFGMKPEYDINKFEGCKKILEFIPRALKLKI